jgi:hypothetical protein
MTSTTVAFCVFAMTFGGVLIGRALRRVLPAHHLSDESKDSIKLGIGLIATMSALVLGLVTASAKSAYDAVDTGVRQAAVQLLSLDRTLARYGPETAPIRSGLRKAIETRIAQVWPEGAAKRVELDPLQSGTAELAERLTDAIRALAPGDERQRALQARAIDQAESLLQARWLALEGLDASVPAPFLAVLVLWLTVTFASFGLFAPRNGTVIAVLLVCAVSIAGAMFLVLEMDGPFDGLLRASPDPLRYAYEQLGR